MIFVFHCLTSPSMIISRSIPIAANGTPEPLFGKKKKKKNQEQTHNLKRYMCPNVHYSTVYNK